MVGGEVQIAKVGLDGQQKKVKKEGIGNVKTILADATKTRLPEKSIDVAFLFGFVHHTKSLENILSELYHILKPKGILSIEKTPWISEKNLVTAVEKNGFIYSENQGRILLFKKRKLIQVNKT